MTTKSGLFYKTNNNNQKQFYKLSEVADLLGRDKRTIKAWCRKGLLPYYKLPRGVSQTLTVVNIKDLNQFLKKHKGE